MPLFREGKQKSNSREPTSNSSVKIVSVFSKTSTEKLLLVDPVWETEKDIDAYAQRFRINVCEFQDAEHLFHEDVEICQALYYHVFTKTYGLTAYFGGSEDPWIPIPLSIFT